MGKIVLGSGVYVLPQKKEMRKCDMSFMRKRRIKRMIRNIERAYGISLSGFNREEISLWLVRHDPYLAELLI